MVTATAMLALSANMFFSPQLSFAELDNAPSVEAVTVAPTEKATQEPTEEPTEIHTVVLTQEPSKEYTAEPTKGPTEEPTVEPTPATTAELTQSPAPIPVFSSGYALIQEGVKVYGKRSASEENELGQFNEAAYVYALERFGNGESDEEWMRVAFAVKTEGEVKLEEGFVKAFKLEPVSAEKSEALKGRVSAEPDCVYYGSKRDIPLAAASFEMKSTEKTEIASSEQEPAEGATAVTDTDDIQEPTPEPIEAQEILIEASWAQETLGIRDAVTLTALYEGDCTVVWQYADETGVWHDAGLTGLTTIENYTNAWRAILEPYVAKEPHTAQAGLTDAAQTSVEPAPENGEEMEETDQNSEEDKTVE